MKKLLQFGAGNIGRSFIGQLFSAAGYAVVFADVDERLITALNEKRGYTVSVRDKTVLDIPVANVRAIDVRDASAVARELADATICGTAVGLKVLPALFPVIASALLHRRSKGAGPIDIILCENLRDAAAITRNGLRPLLPAGFPLEAYAGLVETSIGKMVPLISEAQRMRDPLTVFAEAYHTLILDRRAFLNPVPDVPGLSPKENMKAYVDRKSFVHNLGHAALAYFAFVTEPGMVHTYEAMDDPVLRRWTRNTMEEAGAWLLKTYPDEFTRENMDAHIEDLLNRFANRNLGDTLHRVGRDLARKLSAEDRVAGALRACTAAGLPCQWITAALACGLFFMPPDNDGRLFGPDAALVRQAETEGPEKVLTGISGLGKSSLDSVCAAYRRIREARSAGPIKKKFEELIVLKGKP